MKEKLIQFDIVRSDTDLRQMLALQQQNLATNLTPAEASEQGFVTVQHDLPLLRAMNHPHPHSVARVDDLIVGYALIMSRAFEHDIPILKPMFDRINVLQVEGMALEQMNYFIMGQVCIKKAYRGKGIFKGLYHHMRDHVQGHYACVITEVAVRNGRSSRAHEKVGFKLIHAYTDPQGEDWQIILWDWK